MVDFDGSDDKLVTGTTTYGSGSTLIATMKLDNTSGTRTIIYIGNYNIYSPFYNWIGLTSSASNWVSGNYNSGAEGSVGYFPNDSDSDVLTGIVNDGGVNRIFKNGIAGGTGTARTININAAVTPSIGATKPTSSLDFWDGKIGVVGYFPSAFSASLRKRFEHAQAYSFKIACS